MVNRELEINELVSKMTACSELVCDKNRKLDELLNLQEQLSEIVFDIEVDDKKKIWDIWDRIDELNFKNGDTKDELYFRVKRQCMEICNSIKGEISGCVGERKAFNMLNRIQLEHRVIRNLKIGEGQNGSELDAVVLTRKGFVIVEVKNTKRDVMITSNGEFYRIGEYMSFDKNIGTKMNYREQLLRETLYGYGIDSTDIPILKLVVFTNNGIDVANKCDDIKTTFLAPMPYIIEKFGGEEYFSSKELDEIADILERARCVNTIPWEMDMEQFKYDFARLYVRVTGEEVLINAYKRHSIWERIFCRIKNGNSSMMAVCNM